MSAESLAKLEQYLTQFTVAETGQPLGGAGSRFQIEDEPDGPKVSVHFGFPLARRRATLEAALVAHCERLGLEPKPRFVIDWSIEAHAVQQALKPLPGVANVIAVASGKGGVGKSTVAVNLALALAQEGARVGLLDADIYGPSQPRMLGLAGRQAESRDGKFLEPLEAHGISAMSIGFLIEERQPMAWRGPMVTSALNQMLGQTRWGELDYLLVDMPPGTGDIQLTLAQRVPVSGAIIVTTPQDVALADARKGLEMFRKVNVPVLGVVENMSAFVDSAGVRHEIFGSGGGAKVAEHAQAPLLGQIPLDPHVREWGDKGTPVVQAAPEEPAASAFADVATKLRERIAGEGLARGGKADDKGPRRLKIIR